MVRRSAALNISVAFWALICCILHSPAALSAPTFAMTSSSCGELPLTPIAPTTLPSTIIGTPPCERPLQAKPAPTLFHSSPGLRTLCWAAERLPPCGPLRYRRLRLRLARRRAVRARASNRRHQQRQLPGRSALLSLGFSRGGDFLCGIKRQTCFVGN